MGRYPVLSFYLLAILISWIGWAPVVLGSRGVTFFKAPYFQVLLVLPALGPMLAAVIVSSWTGGKEAVGRLFTSLIHWRVPFRWYLVAIALPASLLLIGKVVTARLALTTTSHAPVQANLAATFITALVIALLSNPWEEVGWRGFALPHLQSACGALSASLIVGLMWGIWHLPLFFWPDNPMSEQSFWVFLIGILASACLYTWLYNSSGHSLLIVTLYHITWNTIGAVTPDVSGIALAVEEWIVAIVLIVAFKGVW